VAGRGADASVEAVRAEIEVCAVLDIINTNEIGVCAFAFRGSRACVHQQPVLVAAGTGRHDTWRFRGAGRVQRGTARRAGSSDLHGMELAA